MRPSVSVIIPVYNQWPLTADCLRSLAAHTPENPEVVVVDNGSGDATATELAPLGRALFGDRFVHLRREENTNFGPGCNHGAREASGSLLFFLNNDTLLTPGWLTPLVEAAADSAAGAVGPVCLYPGSERVQHLGVVFYVGHGAAHLHQHIPGGHPLAARRRTLQTITGAALMVKAKDFSACGGFFEGYVNGCEDIDLCCRLRERGLECSVTPDSRIYHIASQSQGRFEQDARNSALYKERCAHVITPDFHQWCRKEGFELRVTPSVQVYMAVPERRSREFAARFGPGASLTELWDFLEDEPLWEEGYSLLCDAMAANGLFDEAIALRTQQHLFFPRLEYCRNLLVLGRKGARPDVVASAENAIRWHLGEMADTAKQRAVFGDHVRFFRETDERELEMLFQGMYDHISQRKSG